VGEAAILTDAVSEPKPYPEPPWQMHGFAVMCPVISRAADLELPPALEPVVAAGRATGMIGYVEYLPPSPLSYHELIWMPCQVRFRSSGGLVRRGYYVARMYVDDEATLAGGREIWGLPKTLAKFVRTDDRVSVRANDGTDLELSFRGLGPRFPAKTRVTTLQAPEGDPEVIRFRGSFDSRARVATLRVSRIEDAHPAWRSFGNAWRLPRPAVMMDPFDSEMGTPERFER
jgi:hypothetical protein